MKGTHGKWKWHGFWLEDHEWHAALFHTVRAYIEGGEHENDG